MRAKVLRLIKAWDSLPRDARADSLEHYLDSTFDPSDGYVSAHAGRLARGMLRKIPGVADRAFADSIVAAYLTRFELTDTVMFARGEFLRACAALHIEFGEAGEGYRLTDSLLSVPGFSPITKRVVLNHKVYIAIGQMDYTLALALCDELLELSHNHPVLSPQLFDVHTKIAASYIELEQYHEALPHVRQAVAQIERERPDTLSDFAESTTVAYLNYAEVAQRTGHAADAQKKMAKAWETAERYGRKSILALCSLVAMRAATYDGSFEEAEEHHAKAAEFFTTMSPNLLRQYFMKSLIQLRVAQHRFEEAYHLRTTYALVQDSLTRALLANDSRAEARSATLRAELTSKELQLARADRAEAVARTRTTVLVAGLVFAIAGVVLTRRRARQRKEHAGILRREVAARTRDLREKTHRLEDSNRELERFAYIASHDLKTPLRNVTSFLNLIDRRLPADARPAVGEYVDLATDYARQMHALVTDVLEFSRVDADLGAAASEIDLAAVVRRIGAAAAGARGEGARVTVTGAGTTYAPPAEVERLIGNLVANGLKYNESSEPTVEVVVAACATDPEYVEVSVSDNGIGIAPEYHAQVFELFKRLHTSDRYTGTGLGLAVVKKVVERIGGSVRLESAEGEGSTFVLRLPRASKAAHASEAENAYA